MINKKDILKPHDYDGIQEYDNNLPLWWVGTFVITVIFGFCYWLYYHVYQQGPNQEQEYHLALTAHHEQSEKGGGEVGVNSDEIMALSHDAVALAEAKTIFMSNCMACHGANAQGSIGPNLTDNYWIHGGKPADIVNVITKGVPEKGMVTWKGVLGAEQIEKLAAYIISLKGSNPEGAKSPQGDLVEE